MKKKSSKKVRVLSQDEICIELLRKSEIVDERWYLENNPDLHTSDVDPVVHYYFQGWLEGRNPCYLFDTRWYLERYLDVANHGINPLLHYLQNGEREGRLPSPYFEPNFYREQLQSTTLSGSALTHFLKLGWQMFRPNEFFDTAFYLQHNSDVAEAGIPPLRHYLSEGWREHREINSVFSFVQYAKVVEDRVGARIDPLRYYLLIGRINGEAPPKYSAPASRESGALQIEIGKQHQPGQYFEAEYIGGEAASAEAPVRAFAFYLPQFYPFPENDEWWGKGFTEWRNVTRALPRFEGHQQPRLPADLGFYDLRNPQTIQEQVAIAKRSGISGFCFYYYWFNGTRLLDKPLDLFVKTCPEFPFSLMWANENWTRRWDGLENDVLMRQDYREEDDIALVADLAHYFALPSYEKVDNRPLFFIYRPGIIPQFKKRLKTWRRMFHERHGMEPLVLMALAFDDYDPTVYGLDGGIEFPPHKLAQGMPAVNDSLKTIDKEFTGHYMSYDALVESSLAVSRPSFELIRTAVPGWDNEARKPGRGMGFVNSTPAKYESWLRSLSRQAIDKPFYGSKPYVFINAWNEWAEGAHLEPDLHNGVAYLNATFRAVTGQARRATPTKDILLVGHDAYLHGAQLLTLNIMKTLSRKFGLNVTLLLLEGGPLLEEYKQYGEVIVVGSTAASVSEVISQIAKKRPEKLAICNTVVTGEIVDELRKNDFKVVSLIHELSQLIVERSLEARAMLISTSADHVVFASRFVKESFEGITGPIGERAILRPQGIYQTLSRNTKMRSALRKELGISAKSRVIINMGYGDLRKGFDLFVGMAKQVISLDKNCHFLWLGNIHGDLKHWFDVDLACAPLKGNFHIVPFSQEVGRYLNGADVFALTSREDPFPSVVLEALACGLPIVAFDGGGGYVEAITQETINGTIVPMGDMNAMALAIIDEIKKNTSSKAAARAEKAKNSYNWDDYVFGLLKLLNPDLQKVSVVVPNYNYARYLVERLSSITAQHYPIYELIILDDKSSDNSLGVIQEFLEVNKRMATVIPNQKNSGSVFAQWEKAASVANGDLLWIAEADDSCTPEFLSSLVPEMSPDTTLAFTDSVSVDSAGSVLSESYGFYYKDLPMNPLTGNFKMDGAEFVASILSIKNVIMNVSGAVFKRQALVETLTTQRKSVREYKVAGDWHLYVTMLAKKGSEVAFTSCPNNVHRRHAVSVTHALNNERHIQEIKRVQEVAAVLTKIPAPISTAAKAYLDNVTAHLRQSH